MQHLNSLIPTLISSIPIWTILLFFLYRSVKNRDAFENQIVESFRNQTANYHAHATALALLKNDLENIKETIKSINLSIPNIEKFKIDLEMFYKRLKDVEKNVNV